MKTTHCDPRLLTRFTNRALVIGSSAALTLGLGMTGFVPAAFATETPTPEVPSQESPAAPNPVTDPAPSDATAPAALAADPAANAPTASANLATPVQAPPAPAVAPADPVEPSDPAFTVTDVDDSEIPQLEYGFEPKSTYGDALGKLSADKDYTTQHDDTLKVYSGDTVDIKSNLDINVGLHALEGWQEKVQRAKAGNLTYSEAGSGFQTIILVPEYLEMPSDPRSYKLETHNGNKPPLYRIVSVLRSTKRLAITLALNEFYETGDSKEGAYLRLKDGFKAYANKPLGLVISGVKVKDKISPEGTQATLEFNTAGYLYIGGFSSTNRREKARYFSNFLNGLSRSWYTLQGQEKGSLIGNGTDSTRPQSNGISLTMDIKPKPTPADPVVPNPNPPVNPDTPSVIPGPVPGGTVVPPSEPVPPVAGVTTTPTEPQPPVAGVVTTPIEPQPPVAGVFTTPVSPQPPVAGVFTPAAPRIPVAQVPDKALAATGSSAETLAGGAMIVFLAGGAMMVASRRRARR